MILSQPSTDPSILTHYIELPVAHVHGWAKTQLITFLRHCLSVNQLPSLYMNMSVLSQLPRQQEGLSEDDALQPAPAASQDRERPRQPAVHPIRRQAAVCAEGRSALPEQSR